MKTVKNMMALLNNKMYLCYVLRHSPHTSVNTLKLLKDEYSISDVICICSIQNKKNIQNPEENE